MCFEIFSIRRLHAARWKVEGDDGTLLAIAPRADGGLHNHENNLLDISDREEIGDMTIVTVWVINRTLMKGLIECGEDVTISGVQCTIRSLQLTLGLASRLGTRQASRE